jgi:hypothetical protein
METPESHEEPLGTVRAYAAPRGVPPRGRGGGPGGAALLVLALLVLVGTGAFLAWHFANAASTAPAGGAGRTTAAKERSSKASASRGRDSRSGTRAPAGGERRAVVAVASVLAFGGAGRTAAQRGDWSAALRNRQATLARLARAPVMRSLTASVGFLRAALQASIKADQARVRCGCGAENPQDVAATELKRRFLAGFNPLASRYLRRTYSEPDI